MRPVTPLSAKTLFEFIAEYLNNIHLGAGKHFPHLDFCVDGEFIKDDKIKVHYYPDLGVINISIDTK